jgi:2,5-furandicarboxylate decarboxylase 1
MEQSMRAMLQKWESTGDLHYVERTVDPRFELGAVLSLRREGRTQFFRKVQGYEMSVVGNLLNTREKIARALNVERSALQALCLKALDDGIEPATVQHGPVQEVVHDGPIDLESFLPAPTWFEREGGPYITAGVIVAKDPETGFRNVSIARLRLEGGDRLLAGISPSHHLSELLRKAGAGGEDLGVAVSIGNHAAVLVASQMYVELGRDEYDIAGALLKEPLRLVRCQTVDLEGPAEAEIVLEGLLRPDRLIEEGPVSEFPGFYVNYGPGCEMTIRSVSHRRDAIYQAILPGYAPEHCLLGGVAIGATTCRAARRVMSNVRRVSVTDGGMGRLHAVITLHEPQPGDGKRAIMLAMGQVNLLKLVIAVDDEIDPEDWTQVEWAMATRMRADEDLLILPGAKADRCEPLQEGGTVTKLGIVATSRPGDAGPDGRFQLAQPPLEILDRVRRELDTY